MNPVTFIETKREGRSNDPSDIRELVRLVMTGGIGDYQVAAWLMAVFFRGMSAGECRVFTESLASSGKIVSFPDRMSPVDKHSTGGVGDKTTLAVVPLAAACGIPVAKLSGRGLGFTGGTIDKLESIPGFRAHLEMDDFVRQVRSVGCAISGHSGDLAPAEAIFYELRDVTGTIPSIPLITSSIVSKKVAGGSKSFVFDVKCGSGAFMEDQDTARELAQNLVELSSSLGKTSMAFITDMSQPLGRWVGNAAEVGEAMEVLEGRGPGDTAKLSITLAGAMVFLGGKAPSLEEGKRAAEQAILSGRGYSTFREMILSQGGDLEAFRRSLSSGELLGSHVIEVRSEDSGYVDRCDARTFGEAIRMLGGGRFAKGDGIDHAVSCEILRKTGEQVSRGEVLARIYCKEEGDLCGQAADMIGKAYSIGGSSAMPGLIVGSVGPVHPK
jgi:pyrimidine-nucleoside phosphorylase